jgi:hypothetical protein
MRDLSEGKSLATMKTQGIRPLMSPGPDAAGFPSVDR